MSQMQLVAGFRGPLVLQVRSLLEYVQYRRCLSSVRIQMEHHRVPTLWKIFFARRMVCSGLTPASFGGARELLAGEEVQAERLYVYGLQEAYEFRRSLELGYRIEFLERRREGVCQAP